MTSSWMRVESTSMTTRRRPRRARPAGATAMSTPWTCDSRASSRRRTRTSAPETSNSTVVTGYRESLRMRSMLAPWAAIREVTAATALARRGAPNRTTRHAPGAPWRVVTLAGRNCAVSPSWPATSATTRSSRLSAPAPGASSMARVRWPRTTTCSRSSTCAPTSAMASKSALVTPGRSSPLTVTSRVGALRGRASSTAQRYRPVSGLPVRVSPCDQVADGAQVVVRPAQAHGEEAGAHGIQRLCPGGVVAGILGEAPGTRGHSR